jgi:ornithine carbamoyltransferase
MTLKTKDVLTLGELTADEFDDLLKTTIKMKKNRSSTLQSKPLQNKTLAMIFQKPSTRTRISFEVGMYQLGGYALNLASSEMQLDRGETIEDTARTLSRYVDCIMARVYDHESIQRLAKHSTVPVINGLSNSFHPCQTLADFTTILEHKGSLQDLRIAWVGDGNNVCNSLIYGAALSEATIYVATPKEYQPISSAVQYANNHTEIHLTSNAAEAAKNADVIVTDTFKSIHDADGARMAKLFPKYQVNDSLMSLAKDDAIFLHCLPATRGNEVTSSVIDGPRSVVWDEAENRLHSQKTLLLRLLTD